MLSTALGASIRKWRFFRQGLLTFLVSTLCIVAAGILIDLLMEPHIKFTDFSSPPLTSFLIAMVIGIGSGFGTVDEADENLLVLPLQRTFLFIQPGLA